MGKQLDTLYTEFTEFSEGTEDWYLRQLLLCEYG